jgi:CubicO group peptidase (beta-lactamase class C family)
VTAVAVLLSALVGALPSRLPPEQLRRIDGYFQQEVKRGDFPGGALAIVEGDKMVLLSTAGVADLDTHSPVTADTVFCIASLTKSFTAIALLQLKERGLVELDAPVARYLPWFRVADEGLGERITLRQLLNHTSGLPTNSHSVVWQDDATIRNSRDLAVRALKDVSLHNPPGARFEYANMNYVVIGRVIEAVSGQSWDDYVAEHIFAPLGMRHTATHVSAVDQRALARPYGPEHGWLAEAPLQVGDFIAPASNILSTVSDMARYASSHLGAGPQLVSSSTLAEAHLGGADKGGSVRYSMGWENERMWGLEVIHHGGTAGHSAQVYLVPERQLAVVTLFGAYGHIMNNRIARGVLALALSHSPPPDDGPNELTQLMWIERGAFGVTLACPSTLVILPLIRRRWSWRRRVLVARALCLVSAAVALWLVAFVVVPNSIPELPLPFGIRGWTTDLAMVTAAVLFTANGWALWGVATVFRRARAIAAVAASRGAQS